MEQREATKNDVVDLLRQWENEQVRIYIFSRGVGVNYWGYLDLAYDTSVGTGTFAGAPPPPNLVLLCRIKGKEGALRRDIPIVVINLDDFTSFQIIEDDSIQSASLENTETPIRVLIERSQYESA